MPKEEKGIFYFLLPVLINSKVERYIRHNKEIPNDIGIIKMEIGE
jgi:hypothetical protein